ncbi:MAG: hypothetical protein Q9226_005550 [Calogaya cf. arnoldii]
MSSQLEPLLAEIKAQGHALDLQVVGARRKLLNAATSLIAELETPVEKITRIAWAEPALYTALRISIDLKLFDVLVESEKSPKSIAELARATHSDPQLLARILKHLGAMKVLTEPEPGVFGTTQLAEALVIPEYRDSICACFDLTGLPLIQLPAYLNETGYRNPTNPADGPFQYAHNTKQPFFDYLKTHPELSVSFNNYMAGHRRGRPNWMDADFYPVEDALKDIKLHPDTPLLVDIGGGKGHDVMEFKKKFPSTPGRLIVQDLPDTIQRIESSTGGIEFLPHDFFTPQPIKERSEERWRDLLSSAGLNVVKIWNHPEGTESLIETEIA